MKRKSGGINTGTSLILVIVVVMCVVTFAVLSYSSAVSDNNLSALAAEHTREYYEACNRAEERLELYRNNAESMLPYITDKENNILEFTEKINDTHYLKVRAAVKEDNSIEVIEWTSNIL